MTWCIPCVTITKGHRSSSPTESSESQTSESTVIKKSTTTSLQTMIQHRRSASVSSNCSHAVQCATSDTESGFAKSGSGSGLKRPCIKHHKTGLSQSYDDLLSATSNSSVNSTYGFPIRKPVLKRSNSVSTRVKTGYSTNSLCSNKSVKFKLPDKPDNNPVLESQKKTIYYFSGTGSNNPVLQTGSAQSYFVCQNYCANCGVCPFTASTGNFYSNPNIQYALIQAQNFFNYQVSTSQLETTG